MFFTRNKRGDAMDAMDAQPVPNCTRRSAEKAERLEEKPTGFTSGELHVPRRSHTNLPSIPPKTAVSASPRLQRSGCAEHANLHLTSHLSPPAVNAQPVPFATHFLSLALPFGQTNNQNSTCRIHARQQGLPMSRNVQPGRQVLCTRANTRCSGCGRCSPDQREREQDRQARSSMLAAKTTTYPRSTRESESVRRTFCRLRGFPNVCCRTADPVIASAMQVSQHPSPTSNEAFKQRCRNDSTHQQLLTLPRNPSARLSSSSPVTVRRRSLYPFSRTKYAPFASQCSAGPTTSFSHNQRSPQNQMPQA